MPAAPVPSIVDRTTWQSARDELLEREKAHTHEGDAIAAARRRLPMTPVAAGVTVEGADGRVPFADIFEGRRMLVAYFHMWHDGKPWEQQCEGCTFVTSHLTRMEYLNDRDVTVAVLCEGTYAESKPYADFLQYPMPWYSARGVDDLVAGRGFGLYACYLREGDHVYETYWTTGRGTEVGNTSYGLVDLTVYGRQEGWQDSPDGWPTIDGRPDGHQWRAGGRPTVQWSFTDEPVANAPACH